jgi:Ser/Thr protein kinase RdoA (MazF antagonist)
MPLPPSFECGDAEALAAERFGLAVRARVLHGYADRNFRLEAEDGRRWVLKIAHVDERQDCLAAQDELLERLVAEGLAVPRVVEDRRGRRLGKVVARDGREHLVRLVEWLPGRLLLELPLHPEALLEDLGRCVGRVALALRGFDRPALHRRMRWDLAQALDVRPLAADIADDERRAWVEEEYARFEEQGLARLRACPPAVVHGDVNDHNTARVCDPAIAAAYAMLAKDDPLATGAAVLRGYQREAPLGDDELSLVLDLVRLRMAVSVTLSAHEARLRPGDAYLDVTRSNTWRLLEQLRDIPRARADETFLAAIA